MSQLPIPEVPDPAHCRLAVLAHVCTHGACERYAIQSAVRRQHPRPCSGQASAKLASKLHDWHGFGSAAFRAEVKRAFHHDIPVKERGEREAYLADSAAKVKALTDAIAAAEGEIDQFVHGLFDLPPTKLRFSKHF